MLPEGYYISTERSAMDIDFIHGYLSEQAYWALGRNREEVIRSMDSSICFGLFGDSRQIGFGRVATDYVVFAWLMDLFIDPDHRGKGLGKALVRYIVEYPELQNVNGMGLRTVDAHELYTNAGFGPIPEPATWMFKKMK